MLNKHLLLIFVIFFSITACTTNNSTATTESNNSNPEITQNEDSSLTSSFSIEQIALNNNSNSCWTYLDNNVYDITDEIQKHPGGSENILKICGKNGKDLFDQNHKNQALPNSLLGDYLIGTLED